MVDTEGRSVQVLNRISSQLNEIVQRLKSIESVMRLGQSSAIDEMKKKMFASKLRSQIYELSDTRHSVLEISKELGKPGPLVTRYLREMEQMGLVASEQRGKEKYYYKVI